ncbi:MAG: hypothetical protein ACFFA6_08055 [Promethearchaeota archaeon]
MLLEESDWSRYIGIFIIGSFITVFFYFLALKVIKRNFNRLTLTLGTFYILPGTGFFLNFIFLLISSTPQGLIIYYTAVFLILFGEIFLVLFLINILKIDSRLTLNKQVLITIMYAILCVLLILFPGGITINEKTDWIPVFSWSFLIVLYIFFTCSIFIPTLILSIKLSKRFEDKILKSRLRLFFIGIILMNLVLYGLILYNTWIDSFYRELYLYLSFLVIPAGILIYYGLVHQL